MAVLLFVSCAVAFCRSILCVFLSAFLIRITASWPIKKPIALGLINFPFSLIQCLDSSQCKGLPENCSMTLHDRSLLKSKTFFEQKQVSCQSTSQ